MTIVLILAFAKAAMFAVNADLVLKPRDTEAMVGDSTYFDCSSNMDRNEINWFHYAVGAKDHEDVCLYCWGRVHPQYEERIQIERHISTSNSRLRINSVQLKDAGIYICADNGGIGESTSAQLVVLESSPTCTSNIQPDGVLGPISCNIEPDELHLSCSISYNGNIPPKIQWREIRTLYPMDKTFSCQAVDNRVTCNLAISPDLSLNGASYICQTNRSATTQYSCTSDIIIIIYAKSDTSITETILGSEENFNCSARSSQMCSYVWKWFDGLDEEVVSNNSVLTPWKVGWYKCEANCNIRGEQCTVLSRVVHVSEAKTLSDRDIFMWSLIVCLVIMSIISFRIVCIIRRRRLSSLNKERLLIDLNYVNELTERIELGTKFQSFGLVTKYKQSLLIDISKANTDHVEMNRLNSSATSGKAIYGMAILGKKIFVVRQSSTIVEVYDVATLSLNVVWELEEIAIKINAYI